METDGQVNATAGRRKPIGNHNRSWIWGRHTVLETVRAGHWRPLELLYSDRCPPEIIRTIEQALQRLDCPIQQVSDSILSKRCRSDEHQGLAAFMPEFPYVEFETLLNRIDTLPRWLVLDGIQDSFNLGAILRSAVELGTDAVLLGTAFQTGVTCQTARSSAGAVNYIPISRVPSLSSAVEELKRRGIRFVAASEKAERRLSDVDWTVPTSIVVGNESRGVSEAVWKLCDEHVRIPTTNRVGSLNAAVAAGIFCYERWRNAAD